MSCRYTLSEYLARLFAAQIHIGNAPVLRNRAIPSVSDFRTPEFIRLFSMSLLLMGLFIQAAYFTVNTPNTCDSRLLVHLLNSMNYRDLLRWHDFCILFS